MGVPAPIRVVLAAWGSSGDVLPIIAVGSELRRRGHEVTFIGNAYFADAARAESLSVVAVGTTADHERLMNETGIFGPNRRSWEAIYADHYYPLLDRLYDAVASTVAGGPAIIVGEEAAAAAIAEARRLARVSIAPSSVRFFSRYDPPHPEQHLRRRYRWLARTPFGMALFYRLHHLRHGVVRWPSNIRPLPLDHPVARIRARAGLALGSHATADLTLCLWPDWFAAPRRDWPRGAVTVGFPIHRPASSPGPDRNVDVPGGAIIATTGSSAGSQHRFYATVTAASRLLQRPVLLVTPHREHIPPDLPPDVRHLHHLAFGDAFRQAALVVHHGGIGTAALALSAGVPQIVVPRRGDQFDNGNRLVRLGVARMAPLDDMTPENAARMMMDTVTSTELRTRCRHWQARVNDGDGLGAAAGQIEQLWIRRPGSAVSAP